MGGCRLGFVMVVGWFPYWRDVDDGVCLMLVCIYTNMCMCVCDS